MASYEDRQRGEEARIKQRAIDFAVEALKNEIERAEIQSRSKNSFVAKRAGEHANRLRAQQGILVHRIRKDYDEDAAIGTESS